MCARCGTDCDETGARRCDCEPRVATVALPAGSQLARVAVLAALLGGDRRAVRDAAWLVRGGAA